MTSDVIHIDESLLLGLPAATPENPFAQVKWIFQHRQSRVPTRSGQNNYEYALGHYLVFLEETEGKTPFVLKECWDAFCFLRFRMWLENVRTQDGSRALSAHSKVGVMSSVRQVMTEAKRLGLTASSLIVNVAMEAGWRETETHNAYSREELAAILEVVKRDMQYTNAVLAGYTPTGVGRNPGDRPLKGGHISRANVAQHGYGWRPSDNIRWYFENKMNCIARSTGQIGAQAHTRFFQACGRYHGGYLSLYRSWGVSIFIDHQVLWPLVIQLAYLTGLNPESLATLRFDCLSEHPLTKSPMLCYFKLRSEGEKRLLLETLNDKESTDDKDLENFETPEDDYEIVEIPLRREHAVLVQRTIDKVLRLTKHLRERLSCPPEIKERLFIYESSGHHCFGEIQPATTEKMQGWWKKISEDNELRTETGQRFSFTLVRFRPTRLTAMAAQGKDLFEIQYAAGHKSILTTLIYIERNTLDDVANAEVAKSLQQISENRQEFIAFESTDSPDNPESTPYKGLMSDCKNVFAPPKSVRLAADYVEGQACTRFNMCLLCKNIVLLKQHLPYAALYRTQIRVALGQDGVDFPHMHVYQKTLSILDQIFDPATSEFSEEVLNEAIAQSELLDMVIDPLVYSGGVL